MPREKGVGVRSIPLMNVRLAENKWDKLCPQCQADMEAGEEEGRQGS